MKKNQQVIMDAFATQYWHKLDDGRIQCDVCPREYKLHEGQQGCIYCVTCNNMSHNQRTY